MGDFSALAARWSWRVLVAMAVAVAYLIGVGGDLARQMVVEHIERDHFMAFHEIIWAFSSVFQYAVPMALLIGAMLSAIAHGGSPQQDQQPEACPHCGTQARIITGELIEPCCEAAA